MPRLHLFEFHEVAWFPIGLRDLVTDFLSFFFAAFGPYRCVAPVLAEAFGGSGSERIVDLCSGAGQSVVSVMPSLDELGCGPTMIILTDKFPNIAAFRAAVAAGKGRVACIEDPVDATAVPEDLQGFRTLFTSFHHFRPAEARGVLADAHRSNEGIGVFEFTERNLLLWTIPVLLIPLLVWLCTPFIRPFSWRRMLWTYVLPVVPLVTLWDGLVSNLRSYSVSELEELTVDLGGKGFRWQVGHVRSLGLSRVTYAVGWPDRSTG